MERLLCGGAPMPLTSLVVACINGVGAQYRYWGRRVLQADEVIVLVLHSLADPQWGRKSPRRERDRLRAGRLGRLRQ